MDVTVAVCTRNRARLLGATLRQLTRIQPPPGVRWEVLVVDNGSTDQTDRTLREFDGRLPLQRLREPRPGLSHARNHALSKATGHYIIWIDDDVLVARGWLAAYCEAFRRWPDACLFGGPIHPCFLGGRPRWLRRAYPLVASAYGARDLGPEPLRFSRDVTPFGANFAVRRKEQERFPFDPNYGYRPGSPITGEETLVVWALLDAGGVGWWVPGAGLRHLMPRARQTVGYLRRYHVGRGLFKARYEGAPPGPRWLGRPRWVWRERLVAEARYRIARLTLRPAVWVPALERAGVAEGLFRAYGPEATPG